jgi:hypothetical protein
MIKPSDIFGRLGNSLFQYAFLYAYSKDIGSDFYYQDPEYFKEYIEDIRLLFGQDIRPIDMVAIHLRRGDYVNNDFYVDLSSTDYYDRAMKMFPREKFLVFSDDIEYAKSYFVGSEFEFSEDKTEIEDLNLMAGCKGVIMANSSFSWWGAFLGDPDKKVIAPLEWYTDGMDRTKLMPTWIRI